MSYIPTIVLTGRDNGDLADRVHLVGGHEFENCGNIWSDLRYGNFWCNFEFSCTHAELRGLHSVVIAVAQQFNVSAYVCVNENHIKQFPLPLIDGATVDGPAETGLHIYREWWHRASK